MPAIRKKPTNAHFVPFINDAPISHWTSKLPAKIQWIELGLNVFESWNWNFQINLFSFLSSTHEHLHASTLVCWTKYAFKKFQSKIFCLRICLFYYRWYDTPHAMTTMVTWATSPVCYAAMTRQIGHISIGRLVEEKCEPLVPWRKAMEGYLRG